MRLSFCDGEKIVTDGKHRWFVNCDRMFNENGLFPRAGRMHPEDYDNYAKQGVINTETMFTCYSNGTHNIFSIPVTKPLQSLKTQVLPVDLIYLAYGSAMVTVTPQTSPLWLKMLTSMLKP